MKYTLLTTFTAIILAMSNNVPIMADDANIPIYLGTYTRGADGAKGIYLTYLNSQDGSLSEPKLVAEVPNPTFLAKHPTLPRLYSISEGGPSTSGNVHAFAIEPATFALTKLNEQTVPAQGACHLCVAPLPTRADEPGKYAVVVAFYGEGAVASLPLSDDGQLASYASIHKHVGSGPTQRQKQAHAHAVYPMWRGWGAMVVVPDLGADKLFFYGILADGRLAPHFSSDDLTRHRELELPPSSGPRHVAFTSGVLGTAFILNELNSTVSVATSTGSRLEIRQTVSTLPEGTSGEGNTTAEIFLHPNGRFLYVSNRGHDSIALFHFDRQKRQSERRSDFTGPLHETLLEFIETVPCGKHPRSFDISPDGKWLIVAAMNDDTVSTFRIDSETGRLTPTGHSISVKQCACVLPVSP